jgi:hypothetical protein
MNAHSEGETDESLLALKEDLESRVRIARNIGTVQTLVGNEEDIRIAYGFRPSGVIHLGNILSLLISSYIAKELGIHRGKLQITNCDLELPTVYDIPQLKKVIHPQIMKHFDDIAVYFRYLSSEGSTVPMSEEFAEPVINLLNLVQTKKGVQSEVHLLSEIQKEEGFRTAVQRFCERIEEIALYFPDWRGEDLKRTGGGRYLFPVCPECNTGNKQGSVYKRGKLKTHCLACDQDYEMEILDPNAELAVHFLVDPLRDLSTSARSLVHIFGGDYSLEIPGNFTKLEKIAAIFDVVKDEPEQTPILFGGPIVYDEQGIPMGKSKQNGIEWNSLQNALGEKTLQRLWTYTAYILNQGMLHVDFATTRKHLL